MPTAAGGRAAAGAGWLAGWLLAGAGGRGSRQHATNHDHEFHLHPHR